jgi:glycine/D-amino acid oxidase-like deaminating enzyme
MERSVDVLIVGGAITGTAIAWFLKARLGFSGTVMVVEKDFGYRRCSTTLSAASIRQQYSTEINIRMSQYGIEFLRRAPEHLGKETEIGLTENGYLILAGQQGKALMEHNHRLQKSLDVDVTLLDRQSLKRKFDWLQVDDLALGSLGLSGEGSFDAHGLLTAMRKSAIGHGVQYCEAKVVGLQHRPDRIQAATLEDGLVISCGDLVNAAGPAAAGVAAMAGLTLPVESRKRCVFVVHCRELEHFRTCPLVIDTNGVWFRSEGRYFICGVAPPEDQDPLCTDFLVDHSIFEDRVWPSLANRVPVFEALKVVNSWSGHYAVNTLDHNAVLGRHPEMQNFIFANGFSGHGLQHSPAVGRGIAELIHFGGYRSLNLSDLSWQRITENKPLRELNVF